jgi:hypothetical protein
MPCTTNAETTTDTAMADSNGPRYTLSRTAQGVAD